MNKEILVEDLMDLINGTLSVCCRLDVDMTYLTELKELCPRDCPQVIIDECGPSPAASLAVSTKKYKVAELDSDKIFRIAANATPPYRMGSSSFKCVYTVCGNGTKKSAPPYFY